MSPTPYVIIVVVNKIENFFHYNWEDSHFYFTGFNSQLLQISDENYYEFIFD